jgi:hypothetical protein
MHILSCQNCGVVVDIDQIRFSATKEDDFVKFCPLCRKMIYKDNESVLY